MCVTCRICGQELKFNKGGRAPLVTHARKHGITSNRDLISVMQAADQTETDTNPNPNQERVVSFAGQRTLNQVGFG